MKRREFIALLGRAAARRRGRWRRPRSIRQCWFGMATDCAQGAKKGPAHAQLSTDRVKANDAGAREWA
jgi:hypothetical protein